MSTDQTEVSLEGDANAPRPEEERLTQQEKSKRMKEQLELISAELKAVKNPGRITAADLLHIQNVAAGRDKYKTLKQIREGYAKQRIELFEAM